jgi:mono/diheme cytochrome c family protein
MMTTRIARRLPLLLVLVALLSQPFVAAAQEGSDGPKTQPSPTLAAPIYEERCATCHGPSGQGDGAQALQVNLSIPDLTDPAIWRDTTPARWFDIISNGVEGKAMPPFGEVSSNPIRQIDRWNLVYYLYTLGTPSTQVAMGQALYERNCVECHAVDGTGSDDGSTELKTMPDFTDLAVMANRSHANLLAAIQEHDLDLGDVEMWALTDYVRTFSYDFTAADVTGAPAAADTPAVSSPFTGGEGIVQGRVINGTAGSAPPESETIQLRAFDMNANFIATITTTVSADGSYRFEGIDPGAQIQYEPLVVYQEIPYFGDLEAAITLSAEAPEANVDVTVYETTADASDIRIERLHVVFDLELGQAQVAELYILSNDGDRTYVGTLEQGTLPLTIPPNALNFQPGGDPSRYLSLADGIADTVPIPPGQGTAESVLVYTLAYDGELELSRALPYGASVVNVFAPADSGVEITGDQIEPAGPFQAQGTLLDTYMAENLSAGENLTLRLAGEFEGVSEATVPSPHETSGPSEAQSVIIGSVVLAGAVAFAFLYWRGHLSVQPNSITEDRRSDLLQAIAELDDDYEAGEVKEGSYRAKRAELKEELIQLMEAER